MRARGLPLCLLGGLLSGCCNRDNQSDRCCGYDTFGGGVVRVAITDSTDPAYDLEVEFPGITAAEIASMRAPPVWTWESDDFREEGGAMLQASWGEGWPVDQLVAVGPLVPAIAPCGDDLSWIDVSLTWDGIGMLSAGFNGADPDLLTADTGDGHAKVGAVFPTGISASRGNVPEDPRGTSGMVAIDGEWGCRGNPIRPTGVTSTLTLSWEFDPEVYVSHDTDCWAGNGLFGWW